MLWSVSGVQYKTTKHAPSTRSYGSREASDPVMSQVAKIQLPHPSKDIGIDATPSNAITTSRQILDQDFGNDRPGDWKARTLQDTQNMSCSWLYNGDRYLDRRFVHSQAILSAPITPTAPSITPDLSHIRSFLLISLEVQALKQSLCLFKTQLGD